MIFNDIQCYSMLFNDIQCYSMLFNVIQCYSMLFTSLNTMFFFGFTSRWNGDPFPSVSRSGGSSNINEKNEKTYQLHIKPTSTSF